MKIGIICSSGGSAFKEALDIIREAKGNSCQFYAVTDRQCGFEEVCKKESIPYTRIETPDNKEFSLLAKKKFMQFGGMDVVQLFYHRLVTEELFSFVPTINIHPALLPAFKGLRPIGQAFEAKVKFLGASLHQVDATTDGGVIIGQTIMPIVPSYTKEKLAKFSFIQKTFLFLLLIDLLESNSLQFEPDTWKIKISKNLPFSDRCNPHIQNLYYLKGILNVQRRYHIEVIK